jgi:hypothetical protein
LAKLLNRSPDPAAEPLCMGKSALPPADMPLINIENKKVPKVQGGGAGRGHTSQNLFLVKVRAQQGPLRAKTGWSIAV